MEMYDVSQFGNPETYMIQGVESNLHIPSPLLEQSEAMYYEGAPEFVADQGMYYPTATNYGYYCSGYESPSEWEDHHRVFGIDGPDVQYTGAQNEFLNYVYYTPNYGYAQSEYNPYNPYIPGAVMGVDGPFLGAQPYYPISYQNSVSSSAYIPIAVQPDLVPVSSPDTFMNPPVLKSNERGFKTASSGIFPSYTSKQTLNQTNSLSRVPEWLRPNVGSSKQSMKHGSISAGNFQGPVSSHLFQGNKSYSGSPQLIDNISSGKFAAPHSQIKASIPFNNAISEFGQNANGQGGVGKLRPKIGLVINDINGYGTLGEQNRGPRVNKSRNELAVRAYSTKALDGNEDGNIIIYSDQYNKNDFPIDYVDAKFFVIKSYSEDDVHKSFKYNIWSSTPHGNKKLNSAYEDAFRIASGKPKGCPIFLFYSVNASGQFCGVAEMTGPVDFNKDMDFWQQDKWSGSFPVKWHIIKDVPNTNFRHIILENNENKPVTNSRDTQEIPYKKGLEILKIFKNHTLKTSLLDDFMYYENRQKIMQEEKAKFCIRSLEGPFFPSSVGPPRKLNSVAELPQTGFKKLNGLADDLSQMRIGLVSTSEQLPSMKENADELVKETKRDAALPTSNADPLNSRQKQLESNKPSVASLIRQNFDVVTVGSMPVKVNGFSEAAAVLTVGTLPLDPGALQLYKKDANLKI